MTSIFAILRLILRDETDTRGYKALSPRLLCRLSRGAGIPMSSGGRCDIGCGGNAWTAGESSADHGCIVPAWSLCPASQAWRPRVLVHLVDRDVGEHRPPSSPGGALPTKPCVSPLMLLYDVAS